MIRMLFCTRAHAKDNGFCERACLRAHVLQELVFDDNRFGTLLGHRFCMQRNRGETEQQKRACYGRILTFDEV